MDKILQDQLEDWKIRIRQSQWAHYDTAMIYQRRHYWIGLPIVALTAVSGALAVAVLGKTAGPILLYAVAGMSMLSSVMAALQTFLRYAERAEQHRAAGVRFGLVKKQLEQLIAMPVAADGELRHQVSVLRQNWDSVVEGAPTAAGCSWRKSEEIVKKWKGE